MKLFIPLATGQFIPKEVYKSIGDQSTQIDIVPCSTIGIYLSNSNVCKDLHAKCRGEVSSRNLAITLYNEYYKDEKYLAMQDRDVVHLFPDNYERCINFLEKENYDAVALPWKDYKVTEHIRTLAIVFRGDVFKSLIFRVDKRYHLCMTLMEDIKICFLPSKIKLIEEVL